MRITNFASHIGQVIYRRGLNYWKEGRVLNVKEKNGCYSATVQGTHNYTTTVQLDGDEIVSTSCNCPYGADCKHIAALLCEIRERRIGTKKTALQVEDIVPEEQIAFQGLELTEKELFFLCYLAYFSYINEIPYLSGQISVSGHTWKFTKAEQKKCAGNWHCINWLCKTYSFYDFYGVSYLFYNVSRDKVVVVLRELVENHTDWLNYFRSLGFCEHNPIQYAIDILEVLASKHPNPEIPLTEVQNPQWLVDILTPLVATEEPERLGVAVQNGLLIPVLMLSAGRALDNENVPLIERIGRVLDACRQPSDAWHAAYQSYRMCTFYATGNLLPMLNANVIASGTYYTSAVQLLYQNKLDDSIRAFQDGLKKCGLLRTWKFIPKDHISFLMYVIALGLRRKDDDMALLRKMLKKANEAETSYLAPVFALVEFFQSPTQAKNSELLWRVLRNDPCPINRSIASLILCFFGEQKAFKDAIPISSFAVLQCELAACTHGDKGTFPYPPVLQRVPIYETWELELEDIIRNATPATAQTEEKPRKARLCYFYDGYPDENIEVREQTVLKNGSWGKGKAVSASRYAAKEVPMDDIDEKIYTAWSKSKRSRYYDTFPSLSLIIPFLKDTDKLYRETRHGVENVSVREEKPFLFTRRRGDDIVFTSNIPADAEQLDDMWLDCSDFTHWVYYPMPSRQQELLNRIIQLNQVPAKAEPLLRQLFGTLQGQIEVHSDIEGATEMEQVQGQTHLTLRIAPQGELYHIALGLFPLPEGKQWLFPGEGDKCLFEIRNEVRVEVIRNKIAEQKALRQFNEVLTTDVHCAPFSSSLREQDITMADLLCLLEIAPDYAPLFSIKWQEGKKIIVRKADPAVWNISAHQQGGWFDIEGEIPLSDDHIFTMAQLLLLLRESNGNYIRLSPTDYITISDALRRQLERIDAVAQTRSGKVQIPELAMTVLGSSLQGEMDIQEPDTLLQMRSRIRESEQMSFAVPDTLNATLRDYQVDGFCWMMRLHHWGAGACLADDMGLGKTVQTIAVMLAHAHAGAQMVVAPASVIGNWQREIARFAPTLNAVVLNDLSTDDRIACITQLHAGDVLILTYGLLVSESETLAAWEWATVCLDEAHTIKNRDTKSSAAAMQLRAANRIILTGTPIQNHLGELWNLMQFINPGLLGSYDHFNERFVNPIAAGIEEPKLQLKRLIAPFTLRRTKQEVARELPDKTEIQVPITLSKEEMAIYEVLRREAKAQLETDKSVSVNALSMITRLREAACSAALVEKQWHGNSSKLEAMTDKLMPLLEQGNRVLIFSQFTSFLQMAKETILQQGITDILYLDGSTPLKQRQRMVDDFQTGKARVFLISLKAGGLGLNLTGANYVIHLDPWWNPAIEQQATDRAYRIGQKQKVTVYHIIAEHTIEEKILRLHQTKQSLADSLLDGTNMSHKLTTKDLLELLS